MEKSIWVQVPSRAPPFELKTGISAFFLACSINNHTSQEENTNLPAFNLKRTRRVKNRYLGVFCTKEKPLAWGPEKGKAGCQGEGRRRTGLCTGVRRRLWLAPPVAERRSVALPRRKVRNRQ